MSKIVGSVVLSVKTAENLVKYEELRNYSTMLLTNGFLSVVRHFLQHSTGEDDLPIAIVTKYEGNTATLDNLREGLSSFFSTSAVNIALELGISSDEILQLPYGLVQELNKMFVGLERNSSGAFNNIFKIATKEVEGYLNSNSKTYNSAEKIGFISSLKLASLRRFCVFDSDWNIHDKFDIANNDLQVVCTVFNEGGKK